MEEKKLTDEELKKAFFILRHGSDEGLSEYVKAVLAIENEYNRQKTEIERLKEQCSKSSYKDSWKNKFFKAQEEIERLTEERDGYLDDRFAVCHALRQIQEQNAELQKQVDELKDERENMQAEIIATDEARLQAVKDTAKEIFEKLLGYIGSQQQFCIVDDGQKTLIDCDKLFDFVGKLAQEKGVEVE